MEPEIPGVDISLNSIKHSNLKCLKCYKSFFHKIGYLNHMKKHEKIKVKVEPSDVFESKSTKIQKNREKPFSCEFCEKSFTTSSKLKSHKRTHTGEKPFECKVCGKHFNLSGNLKQHEMIHVKHASFEKMIKCN